VKYMGYHGESVLSQPVLTVMGGNKVEVAAQASVEKCVQPCDSVLQKSKGDITCFEKTTEKEAEISAQ
jgi:hypothetical protein